MALAESEFGGKETPTGVQPPPHIPTASEQMMLVYRTGDPSGSTPPDNGEIFAGLRSESAQRAALVSEGVFETVGAVAKELETQAAAEIAALAAEAAPE